jgi:hypothetical protein
MYQRFVIVYLFFFNDALNLTAKPEHQRDAPAQNLIGKKEESRRKDRHNQDHNGCHDRFIARRPCNLRRLGPYLLQKFEWVRLCHTRLLGPYMIWQPYERQIHPKDLAE